MKSLRALACMAAGSLACTPAVAQPIGGATGVLGPRFTVEATKIKAINETWTDWLASDEIVLEYRAGDRHMITGVYGDMDSGETRSINGGQRCIYPAFDPDRTNNFRWSCHPDGGPLPATITLNLYEYDGFIDEFPIAGFCVSGGDVSIGCRDETRLASRIGRYRLTLKEAEMLRAMPTVGSFMTKTVRIDSCSALITIENGACAYWSWWPGYFAYDVTLFIRRLRNGVEPVVEQ